MSKVPLKKILLLILVFAIGLFSLTKRGSAQSSSLDKELKTVLSKYGFTGNIESTLTTRLGRPLNNNLKEVGRNLWFDSILALSNSNSCSGCHAPQAGFGDTQSIAIGIDNNNIVGPNRAGPRNQRRSPMVLNTAFYPALMWNGRFSSVSGDPFKNSAGFKFPDPEGTSLSHLSHLLIAQAFIPVTERNEAAGFEFPGDNFAMRDAVATRVNENWMYRKLFSDVFSTVKDGGPVTYEMIAKALAEFEFSLTFANAPIDKFARGQVSAMTTSQKKGALLFFGKANCVSCHAVSGQSNQMFSDFKNHVIGIPQIVPQITNSMFDGPAANEDFGLEQVTLDPNDRYKFRTSPLRNVGVQPTFGHNGAYTSLEAVILHHLRPKTMARSFTTGHLDKDLRTLGPIEPPLERLDPLLLQNINLTTTEFTQLVDFVRYGLLDPRAQPAELNKLIPKVLPSGRPLPHFESMSNSDDDGDD
jgi:cytochrome c peroxidase